MKGSRRCGAQGGVCGPRSPALRKASPASVSCAGPPARISPSSAARHLYDENTRAWTIRQKSVFPNCFTAYKARPRPARAQQPRPPARERCGRGRKQPPASTRATPVPAGRYHSADPSGSPERYRPRPLIGQRGSGAGLPEPGSARQSPLAALRAGPGAGAMVRSGCGVRAR